MTRANLIIACILFLSMAATSFAAPVEFSPPGGAVAMEATDTSSVEFSLINDGDIAAEFLLDYRLANFDANDHDRFRAGGPQRDRAGDIVEEFDVPYIKTVGMAYDEENGWVWGLGWNDIRLYALNPDNGQVPVNVQTRQRMLGLFYDAGRLYAGSYNNNAAIFQFDLRGQQLGAVRFPRNLTNTDIAGDADYIYTITYEQAGGDGSVSVYSRANNNFDHVADIDVTEWMGRDLWGVESIRAHRDGWLWVAGREEIYQFRVDDDWNAELIRSFEVPASSHCGLAHDGENLWRGIYTENDRTWYVIDDGVAEKLKVIIEPSEGEIAAGEAAAVEVTVETEENSAGVYEVEIILTSVMEGEEPTTTAMTLFVSVDSPVGEISGVVARADNGQAIEGAGISLAGFNYSRSSDAEGAYRMTDLPRRAYRHSVEAPDYLPQQREIELRDEALEQDYSLYFATFNLDPEEVIESLAPDDTITVMLSAENRGDGPLTFRAEKRLVGDANAEPWEVRRGISVGNLIEDDRTDGVAFDGEFFYFSGSNGNDTNLVYVFDRAGEFVRSFPQPNQVNSGMKDLEWDGELLWGSNDASVYGFTTEGETRVRFAGPYNLNSVLAYDPDDAILWIGHSTNNPVAYDRDGNALGRSLNRRGLRIYGLAYWLEDPDSCNLYIFNQPGQGLFAVHKMNVTTNDTVLAHRFPDDATVAPSGAFITDLYDPYSWVAMEMINSAPANGNDRLVIYQLDARKGWMSILPAEGVIDPGETMDFALHLDAAGLPAIEFVGEIRFAHDGVGSQTILPISLDVVEGQVHSTRRLQLARGWNLISTNLTPDNQAIPAIMAGLVENGSLDLVKSGAGNFYWPSRNFDNIGEWLVSEAYFVRMNAPGLLTLEGVTVFADDPIQLREGWQAVAYFPRRAVDARIALSGLAERLEVAKDGAGAFFLPEFEFCNLGPMREGRGYQIKVDQDIELVYRTAAEGASFESLPEASLPVWFTSPTPTGSNMSLLVEAPGREGEIGVLAGEQLVGCGVINRGRVGIAVWQDDPATPAIDGARPGDALEIICRNGTTTEKPSSEILLGEARFSVDGVAALRLEAPAPIAFYFAGAYPNPFNGATTLRFTLPDEAKVELALYDLTGRVVATLVDEVKSAGEHSAIWQASALPAGIYVARLQTGDFTATTKLALVK